jgi:H+-transporting ATPase
MVFFIVGMYLYTGTWVIGAFQMGLLLLLIDFVTLSIAADAPPGAAQPQAWEILPLVALGAATGAVGLVSCITLVALACALLGYSLADPRLGTLALEIIFFTSASVWKKSP